jgi:hypothetical protein
VVWGTTQLLVGIPLLGMKQTDRGCGRRGTGERDDEASNVTKIAAELLLHHGLAECGTISQPELWPISDRQIEDLAGHFNMSTPKLQTVVAMMKSSMVNKGPVRRWRTIDHTPDSRLKQRSLGHY